MNFDYSEQDIVDALLRLGVVNGDCLFVHSALKSLGKFHSQKNINLLESMYEAIFRVIGERGTLAVPAFNFAFCNGKTVDMQNNPGDGMGAFSEYVRMHPRAKRTFHPFHSIALIGKNAECVSKLRGISEFSEESFFDALLKINCKVLFYGIDFVETFVHLAEERAQVPYRFWKVFNGMIINNEKLENISVSFYARKLEMIPEPRLDVMSIGKHLRENGYISTTNLGLGKVSICDANLVVGYLVDKLKENPNFLLLK